MRRNFLSFFLALTLLLLVQMSSSVVLAQSSAGFNLQKYVIGSGGRDADSANYRVNGTVGQSITSQPVSKSANFIISSGYWSADSRPPGNIGTAVYLPAVLKH